MPIPTTITPTALQVIFEIEDSVTGLMSRAPDVWFGTVVLIGSGVTGFSVGDIVLGTTKIVFQEGAYRYVTADEANVFLTYIPPP